MFRIALAALALTTGSAGAQDLSLYGGGELEFAFEEDGPGTGTNSYLSAYLELESRGFYAGIWGQIANDDLADEVDLYLGYRNELASGVSYDVGYIRYIYPNDGGDCCGELTLSLGAPVGEKLSLSLDLAYDPENELGNAYVGAAFAATSASRPRKSPLPSFTAKPRPASYGFTSGVSSRPQARKPFSMRSESTA